MERSQRKRTVPHEENSRRENTSKIIREYGSYQGKKMQYKYNQQAPRVDPKNTEIEKKKKTRKDQEGIIDPGLPKRKIEKLELMFTDGTMLTMEDINEEKKKYNILPTETKEPEKVEKAEKTEKVEEAVKEEKTEKEEKAVEEPEEKTVENAVEEQKEESAKEESELPESVKLEEPTEMAEQTEQAIPADSSSAVDSSAPAVDYGIVKGIPTKIDEVTGIKTDNVWGIAGISKIIGGIFNRKESGASPRKTLPVQSPRMKKKAAEKKETASKLAEEKKPGKTAKPAQKTVTEKEEKEEKISKIFSEKPVEKPVEKSVEIPSDSSSTDRLVGVSAAVPEKSVPEVSSGSDGAVSDSAAVEKGDLFESGDKTVISALPIVFSKEQLLSYRNNSLDVKTEIDKSIFTRSTGSSKKKREFKPSFKMTGMKDSKKPAPATVFSTIEPYIAEFSLALNQVCQNNIEEIAKRILSIQVPTKEAMTELATTFFNRAMQEQAYTAIYAALAENIQKRFRSKEEETYNEEEYEREKGKKKSQEISRGSISIFGNTVAKLVKNEFMTKRKWATEEVEHKAVTMTAEKLAERVMEITSNKEKEYERMRTKKKALTIVRFLIELYMQGFFTDHVMFSATTSLTQEVSPENVERLCYILKYAGKRLDRQSGQEHVTKYIKWLETAVVGMSSRYVFMMEDIKELRAKGWMTKEEKKEESDDEEGWMSSKTKEKKRPREKERQKKEQKVQKISEMVDSHGEDYGRIESIIVSTLKADENFFAPQEQAKRFAAEYAGNVLFFVALIKITIEGYGDSLNNGKSLVREWAKVSPVSTQRKEEVFEYIEEIMPDLIDDSPGAPKYLKEIKEIIHK